MSRLKKALDATRSRGEKAMGLFVTNGFPEAGATVPILHALDRGGADFLELGMPFSDPLAEGLPIQRSSARALANGTTMDDAFDVTAAFRDKSKTPVLLMGYVNPILQYGPATFCKRAAEAGVDGLILPDLPLEEIDLVAQHVQDAGLHLINLIAPNTSDDRIRRIDRKTTGFIYAVSVSGLTGGTVRASDAVSAYLKRARRLVERNPLLVGFGIKSHEDAMALSTHTDGFIVGSALINRLAELWDDDSLTDEERLEAVQSFAQKLKHGNTTPAATS